MTILTVAAALALAANCVPHGLAPVMVGIAQHESGLDTEARHLNPNGTWDYGLAQINTVSLGWLGLTPVTAMDPCRNLAAGAKVLLAKYNGSPPDVVKAAYSNDVVEKVAALDGTPAPPPPAAPDDGPDDPRPPAWDAEPYAEWLARHDPDTQPVASPDAPVLLKRKELK
jgi:Transglycosylase SLT domain